MAGGKLAIRQAIDLPGLRVAVPLFPSEVSICPAGVVSERLRFRDVVGRRVRVPCVIPDKPAKVQRGDFRSRGINGRAAFPVFYFIVVKGWALRDANGPKRLFESLEVQDGKVIGSAFAANVSAAVVDL